MRDATKVYYVMFGILTLVGGIMGYVKAHSAPSLIAGVICGILLFLAAFLMTASLNGSLVLGLLVSISVAGKFVPDSLHKRALFPGGLMAILSMISITLTLLSWYRR